MEFWFEFGSTYSYPAAMRIEREAARYGNTVRWKSFLLGPIFVEQGWSDSPFNLYPAKGRYMWRDMARVCEAESLAFQRPSVFPRDGMLAARVACFYQSADWVPRFVRAVFVANFADDLDISLPSVVAACVEAAGQEPDAILQAAVSMESKCALRRQTELAKARGIFGAPSFVANGELFWGNDRLDQAAAFSQP